MSTPAITLTNIQPADSPIENKTLAVLTNDEQISVTTPTRRISRSAAMVFDHSVRYDVGVKPSWRGRAVLYIICATVTAIVVVGATIWSYNVGLQDGARNCTRY
jgi:hypothetical protein